MEVKKQDNKTLQKVGNAFVLPLMLVLVAGLMFGVGAVLTNQDMVAAYGIEWLFGRASFLHGILTFIKNLGEVIFANLPIIFAVSLAFSFVEYEKPSAALSAVISFLVMHQTISSMLGLSGKLEPGKMLDGTLDSVCGIKTLQMGVFGGIIVGLGVSYIHNKIQKLKPNSELKTLSGSRLTLILSPLVYVLVGLLIWLIWPTIQIWVYNLGALVNTGFAGTFAYGLLERLLTPFGLNKVFCTPFLESGIGGFLISENGYVTGANAVFLTELTLHSAERFNICTARFMAGKFPIMMFGLPAAAFAIFKTNKNPQNKTLTILLILAALTSILAGIALPIELIIFFISPLLFAVHCVFAGLSFMLSHVLSITIGQTLSGGLIEFLLFGIMQGNAKTNWLLALLLGIANALVYYFVFKFIIKNRKININKPFDNVN